METEYSNNGTSKHSWWCLTPVLSGVANSSSVASGCQDQKIRALAGKVHCRSSLRQVAFSNDGRINHKCSYYLLDCIRWQRVPRTVNTTYKPVPSVAQPLQFATELSVSGRNLTRPPFLRAVLYTTGNRKQCCAISVFSHRNLYHMFSNTTSARSRRSGKTWSFRVSSSAFRPIFPPQYCRTRYLPNDSSVSQNQFLRWCGDHILYWWVMDRKVWT
jgi:hypothetical protein